MLAACLVRNVGGETQRRCAGLARRARGARGAVEPNQICACGLVCARNPHTRGEAHVVPAVVILIRGINLEIQGFVGRGACGAQGEQQGVFPTRRYDEQGAGRGACDELRRAGGLHVERRAVLAGLIQGCAQRALGTARHEAGQGRQLPRRRAVGEVPKLTRSDALRIRRRDEPSECIERVIGVEVSRQDLREATPVGCSQVEAAALPRGRGVGHELRFVRGKTRRPGRRDWQLGQRTGGLGARQGGGDTERRVRLFAGAAVAGRKPAAETEDGQRAGDSRERKCSIRLIFVRWSTRHFSELGTWPVAWPKMPSARPWRPRSRTVRRRPRPPAHSRPPGSHPCRG